MLACRSMAPRRIVIVCFPGFELLDVAGPASVFGSANALASGAQRYQVILVSDDAGPVTSSCGVAMLAERSLRQVRGAIDTLLVAGGIKPAITAALPLVPAVARLSGRARRTASVCSGAFLLGAAGLLRGKRVATHWAGCEELARRHPECTVERDPIYVHDDGVWTSAGVTAGIDLALALVEQDHGAALALEVARWGVMYLRRPGGQSQFSAPLSAQSVPDGMVSTLLPYLRENLARDLSASTLSRRVGLSPRQFARVFRKETGSTPASYVERLRLEAARQALELTRGSVKQIAAANGFGTVETMHRAFQRKLAVTPLQYRARFAVAP